MAKKKATKEKFNFRLVPLLLLMFVPMIMYHQIIKYDTELTHPYLISSTGYADIFSYYKSIIIYLVAGLSVLFYVLYTKRSQRELKKDRIKYYVPMAVYAFFIILSTIFAISPRIALFGIYERFEGCLVLLSYLIILFYATEIVRNETDIKYIYGAFLGMTAIVSLIGILQSLGTDIFTISAVQSLIGIPLESQIALSFDSWAYSTLYNPNNVGQFSSLVSPIVLGVFFAYRSWKGKVAAGIVLILTIWVGIASSSANALAGLTVGFAAFFVLFVSNLIPKSKRVKIILFASIAVIFLAGIALSGRIVRKIKNSSFVKNEIAALKPDEDDIYFYDINVTDESVEFDTNAGKFFLGYVNGGITFFDSEMKFIPFNQKKTTINFINEPYKSQWYIRIENEKMLTVYAKRAYSYARVTIVFDEGKFLGIRGTGDKILRDAIENEMPEKWRGLETIASRRGYLWLVTFSRLDEVLFVGAGPDNFLYWFEQNDVVGKVNFLHRVGILADKPHNWFLQIASQTGVVSLLAFLALIGIYFVDTVRILGFRRKRSFYEFVSGGILSGITGFLASSLFVDSTVGITPLFFLFIGIGIVSNTHVKIMRYKDRKLKPVKVRNSKAK